MDSEEIQSVESAENQKGNEDDLDIDRTFSINHLTSFTSSILHVPSSFLNVTSKTDLFS